MKIFGERLRQLVVRLKRLLGMDHRLTIQEFYQLLQLSEAIDAHGRMLQSYFGSHAGYVVVEVSELAFRLREKPETIEDALMLMREIGQAESYDRGCWRLRLFDIRSDDDTKDGAISA
jgi:hypothetical protein